MAQSRIEGQDHRKRLVCAAFAALCCLSSVAARCGAPAGARVTNVATMSYSVDGTPVSVSSNIVATRIDEVLAVAVTPKSAGAVIVPPTGLSGFGVVFTIRNLGNGLEAFALHAGMEGEPRSELDIAVDTNGDGLFDPAVDRPIPVGGTTPLLGPDSALDILVRFAALPEKAGILAVSASAATGTGVPATGYPGQGDGAGDAIVGATGAAASATVPIRPGRDAALDPPVMLTKSQSVLAPGGGKTPVRGAVISYRLDLTVTGPSILNDAEIVDAVPMGTDYVPGSIRVDGAAMSDAADGDVARFDGHAVHVAFGILSQPATRAVTFQVRIQ